MRVVEFAGLLEDIRVAARLLSGARTDYDPLLEAIGEAKYVLWTLSGGCAPTIIGCPQIHLKSACTVWTSTACALQFSRFSNTSTKSILKRSPWRANAMDDSHPDRRSPLRMAVLFCRSAIAIANKR